MFMRARMYAVRNSDGNSSGRGDESDDGSLLVVSGSWSLSAGGVISVGCICDQVFFIISGTGMVNSGFFVRTINVVVAM